MWQVDELRKDAWRYRWLTRDDRVREFRIPVREAHQSIDRAIDEAMKETK